MPHNLDRPSPLDFEALLAFHRLTFGSAVMEDPPAGTPPVDPPPAEDKTFTQADVDRMIADRLKRAKPADYDEVKAKAKQFEELQAATATDLERAVAKAVSETETRVKSELGSANGQRLAGAEFVAAAARRNPTFDAASVLEDLNLAKYVSEDGEPDTDGIAKAVERLVPTGEGPVPSFDGGARTPARPTDPRLADLQQIEADLAAAGRRK